MIKLIVIICSAVLFAGCITDESSMTDDLTTDIDADSPAVDELEDTDSSDEDMTDADTVPDGSDDDITDDEDNVQIDEDDAEIIKLDGKMVGGGGTWPGPIEGLGYISGSVSGVTSADGGFSYETGGDIVFSIGDITFKPVAGESLMSPWQLVSQGLCHHSEDLEKALVLIYSLDEDNDPENGVKLVDVPVTGSTVGFETMSIDDISAFIKAVIPDRELIDTETAVGIFIRQMDSEIWEATTTEEWAALVAAKRAQGVTTDGTYWYFSWQYGLNKTDMSYNDVMNNNLAIPPILQASGSNHIGDIDSWNGTLYAPVEDGSDYKNPKIVLYDNELNYGTIFDLSNTLLTAGVPWVAVDGPNNLLYVAEWDPTPGIYRYDLATVTYIETIPLYPALGRIQGAKIFEGAMYANCDISEKTTYKIDLETGINQPVLVIKDIGEMEGLVFLPLPDGSMMHTMNVTTDRLGSEFRHFKRTREPLRRQICK